MLDRSLREEFLIDLFNNPFNKESETFKISIVELMKCTVEKLKIIIFSQSQSEIKEELFEYFRSSINKFS